MTEPVPRWARVADGLFVSLTGLALWIVLTNKAAPGVFGFVRSTSLLPVLFAAGSVLLVRHVACPSPTTWARVRARCARGFSDPAWGPALRAFAATRVLVFAVAIFAVAAIGLGPQPGFRLSSDPLVNLPARFDAGWYGGIAMDGYDRDVRTDRHRNSAFFPAMPLLMRPVGYLFGSGERARPKEVRMARVLWGGVLISLGAFLCALYYLGRLGERWLGAGQGHSAVLLLAAYPFAFIFNAPYSEGLFLLCSLAAVYYFDTGRWRLAALWALATGLTRPNGFLLALPLGVLALQQLRDGSASAWRRHLPALAVAAMPVIGMLVFTAYLHSITGVWFAWRESHQAWGRSFGAEPLVSAWRLLREHGAVDLAIMRPYDALNALALLFALGLSWQVFRRMGLAWGLFVLATIGPPLFAGGVLSMGRLTSTLFPLFLALAAILPSRAVPHWAVAFGVLQGFGAALFFTWRQLY